MAVGYLLYKEKVMKTEEKALRETVKGLILSLFKPEGTAQEVSGQLVSG